MKIIAENSNKRIVELDISELREIVDLNMYKNGSSWSGFPPGDEIDVGMMVRRADDFIRAVKKSSESVKENAAMLPALADAIETLSRIANKQEGESE